VFHGLLPEPHNTAVVHLLSLCAQWHFLAKLRMHTDHTLKMLEDTTAKLGLSFRKFVKNTCKAFDTYELKRETEARQRRQSKKNTTGTRESSSSSRRPKSLNLQTYKFHAMGDYVATIRQYGTCDSYTTEIVRVLYHCRYIACPQALIRANSSTVLPNPTLHARTTENSFDKWLK
jgi:hypothetical protein